MSCAICTGTVIAPIKMSPITESLPSGVTARQGGAAIARPRARVGDGALAQEVRSRQGHLLPHRGVHGAQVLLVGGGASGAAGAAPLMP